MKLNRKLVLVVALVMSLALVTTGTLAYLTDNDMDKNVMTLGNVEIVQNEQERTEDGTLDEFTQNKPAFPAVGDVTWADEGVDVNGTEYKVFSDDQKNVIDKIVTVTNTGKSDAYVRTIIAIEAPDYDPDNLIHVNVNGDGLEYTSWAPVDIDGVQYVYSVFTYDEALAAGETSVPSLMQLFLDKETTNEDVAKFGDTWEVLVLSQAMQTQGFDDASTALNEGFGEATEENVISWFATELEDPNGIGSPGDKNDTNNPPETTAKADTWDGTSDTSWYNDSDSEFMIMTAEQLAGFAELVDNGNTFEGKTVKLGNNINLYAVDENGEKISFNPIGYGYDIVFKGTFDGQDHTIDNLYQNGWALGYDYSTEGGGLFASVVDATIKNVNIDNAEVVMECVDMGVLVGYSYGNCTYENIAVTNSTIANYQRYTGGVVGEVNGTQSFKNVDVTNTVISSLWGDFDCSLGGIIGGKYGEADITLEDCDVACEINAYNDVTSSYQWYAYRRAGMLIGNSEETATVDGKTSATASYLTAKNCTVTYGDWVNYTYCEFAGTNWPYVRVQEGYSNSAYSNPRYGHPTDANGNEVVNDTHVHNEGEDHNILLSFDQLFGGGQGVYGTATHDGVTVTYNK